MEDCHTDSELLTQFHKNTPQLRFSGFDDEWQEKKLGEIVTEFKNPVELPHNGYTRLGIRSHAKGTFHEYVAPGHELEAAQMSEVKADNLIMSITFAWEHAVAITDKNDEGKLVSQRFPQFSFNKGQVPEFYKYVIADEKFRHHLWLSSAVGAGRNRVLNIKESMEYKSHIPSSDFEQQKIGAFLSHVDSLIQAKTKKLESLKAVKKSLLQKCFPKEGEKVPEMRFAGFSGDWEEKKLGEIAEKFDYGLNAAATDFDGKNKYLRITDIDDENRYFKYDDVSSPDCILSESENYLLRENDIVFARTGASVGKTYIYNKQDGIVYFAGFLIRAHIKQEYDSLFIFQNTLSEPYNKYIQITSQRSGQPGVNAEEYKEYSVMCPPTHAEQQKIGQFFSKYDSFISAQQKEIDKLKEVKKALLQKMFC